MMRNLFGGGNAGNGGGGLFNMLGRFREFMQNPMAAMMNSGLNVPQNIQNNPEGIINYLRSSGQMNEQQFQQANQFAQMAQSFIGNGRW